MIAHSIMNSNGSDSEWLLAIFEGFNISNCILYKRSPSRVL
jgi:hypothetical protein